MAVTVLLTVTSVMTTSAMTTSVMTISDYDFPPCRPLVGEAESDRQHGEREREQEEHAR